MLDISRPDIGPRPCADKSNLTATGVRKSYGATVALEHADISLKGGEVHALLGENGAGKSTLVRILTGAVVPDSGKMMLHGLSYGPQSIFQARAQQVATAFQELSLVSNLSVAQNLLLPNLPKGRGFLVSNTQVIARGREILDRRGLSWLDPRASVASLSLADKQRLEITRALENAGRVLILDEPTASLAETDWLFEQIRQATSQGVAVLYISHRLAEVRAICTSATVLRNGRTIASVGLSSASDADIFEMMVGRRIEQDRAERRISAATGKPGITARAISGGNIRAVSFTLQPGEILGVAGLEGQGQRALFRMLAGLDPVRSGDILVDGKAATYTSPRAALRTGSGIAYLPEERKTEGILAGLSAATNIVLPVMSRVAMAALISDRTERNAALPAATRVDMAPRYLSFAVGDLSGGNQQKVLIARTLATGAKTLLLFDPMRGVDVGTKQSIYSAIRAFADAGGAVLFYSSELPEIVQLADRCMILYDGAVFQEIDRKDISEQQIVAAMTGHKTSGPVAKAAP